MAPPLTRGSTLGFGRGVGFGEGSPAHAGIDPGLSMPLEFSPEVPTENSPLHCVSIASVATRWLGCGEQIQIEIDDGLQRLRGGGIAQAVRQGLAPTGVFGLQSKQFSHGIGPALRAGAPVGWPTIADPRR